MGFSTVVGTRFKFVAKPVPGWNGVVECEMLEAREPSLLRFTWRGGEKDDLTTVTCRLEPHQGGTRLTWEHTGFHGIGGLLVSKMLASVRRKMLSQGLLRDLFLFLSGRDHSREPVSDELTRKSSPKKAVPGQQLCYIFRNCQRAEHTDVAFRGPHNASAAARQHFTQSP